MTTQTHDHGRPPAPIHILVLCAEQDRDMCRELVNHLRVHEHTGRILVLDPQDRPVGTSLHESVRHSMAESSLVLLLLSADFLASDYHAREIVPRLLGRHRDGTLTVMPIYLRACDYSALPGLAKLRIFPSDHKAIAAWTDRDEAWLEVVSALRRILDMPVAANEPDSVRQREDAPEISAWVRPLESEYEMLAIQQLRNPLRAYNLVSISLLAALFVVAATALLRYGDTRSLWLFPIFTAIATVGVSVTAWAMRPSRRLSPPMESSDDRG